jgi:hypothetical protein
MLAQVVAGNILGEATTLVGNILTESMQTVILRLRAVRPVNPVRLGECGDVADPVSQSPVFHVFRCGM